MQMFAYMYICKLVIRSVVFPAISPPKFKHQRSTEMQPSSNVAELRSAEEIGLLSIAKASRGQPFCLFAKQSELKTSLEECCSIAQSFVCETGTLRVLTDCHLECTDKILLTILPADTEQRAILIHSSLAASHANDVLLIVSGLQSNDAANYSDYREIVAAVNGLDLPGSDRDFRNRD